MTESYQNQRRLYQGEYVAGYDRLPPMRMAALVRLCELRRGDAVVDFGCGPGTLLHQIHAAIATYCGVDFSEEFIASARRKAEERNIGNARFECTDIVDFCRRNPSRFDRGFMFDVNHLIDDAHLLPIYAGVRSSLRRSGKFYLHTINADYFLERLKDKKLVRRTAHYVAVRTADHNRDLLRASGFENVRITGISHYQAPLSYLHVVSRIPGLRSLMTARLFIEAS